MEDNPNPAGMSVGLTISAGTPDFDLLDQLLSGDNNWLEASTSAPNCTPFSPSFQSNFNNSIKERFREALNFIKDAPSDSSFLVQLWVPIQRGNQLLLTTGDQPYTLDENSDKLLHYRNVSKAYEFSAEVSSSQSLGLPGRVFIGKLPEWTPDVMFFSTFEYPRVIHAERFDVHGSIALPVFERDNSTCLGVVEVIMTAKKTSFAQELVTICTALQAVDLRTSEVSVVPRLTFNSNSFQSALPEILHVMTTACHTHQLPLAQTWVPCIQQGKKGTRHTDENHHHCISTIDSACYINDPLMQAFHAACSEHHLLKGQGMAGKAFTTNQPCFAPDISSFSKFEYPLSHHARMFNLKGVVAIRLRCTHTGTADFVLEFFLPVGCMDIEEQKALLNSLSTTVQKACQTLRVVKDSEIEEEHILELSELQDMIEPENVDSCQLMDEDKEEFLNGLDLNFQGEVARTEKKRTKMEKTISLSVLRKYFAGSLKDAAKSLGVCPTTLKRICRQHGITRWPSRKIKKVDHSLKKLQLIIDSVHGADPAIQLTALYKDLTKASAPQNNSPKDKKLASSGSNNSSSSGPSSNGITKENASPEKNNGVIQKENTECEQSTRKSSQRNGESWIRIKATCGSENIRLRLDPNWGVKELKDEICSRFNVQNSDSVHLRYLDDDSEWILLTCDADLKECVHVYKSSKAATIKICIQTARKSSRGNSV
ncbi:hypothetical protein LUZ63_009693 [Rhynchospora breviuscula]|uniref:Uncharacterized protein n=1 Tax=Rhynchospora breviuscula TaxID=2022672 RepID=A0A9Q0CFN8_9POAL|nr:hypothetical protein LUZ63_009693 [Rhynchospora breviuscula]